MIPIQLHLVMKLNPIILQPRRHRQKLVNCIQLRFSAQQSMLVNHATVQLYRRQVHVKTQVARRIAILDLLLECAKLNQSRDRHFEKNGQKLIFLE